MNPFLRAFLAITVGIIIGGTVQHFFDTGGIGAGVGAMVGFYEGLLATLRKS